MDHYEEALSDFKRILELSPNYPLVHEIIGDILSTLNRYKLALQEYKKGIEDNKQSEGKIEQKKIAIEYKIHLYQEEVKICDRVNLMIIPRLVSKKVWFIWFMFIL